MSGQGGTRKKLQWLLFTPLELEDESLILQKSPSRRRLLMNIAERKSGEWERRGKSVKGKEKEKEEEEEERAINYSEKNSLKTALFY